MRGVILIEGADASGKTTLAKHLCDKFNAIYIHMTYYEDCWTEHLKCIRKVIELAETQVVVVDRHWISEVAYAEIYRKGSQYPLSARFMDRMFIKMGACHILCIPYDQQAQIMRHAARKNEEMYSKIDSVIKLYHDMAFGQNSTKKASDKSYGLSFLNNGGLLRRKDFMLYDMDTMSPHHLDDKVEHSLSQYEFRAIWRSLNFPNIIGNIVDPKLIFVGETVSNKHPEELPPWPWGGKCDKLSSSKILYQAFQTLHIDETKVAFCNAHVDANYGPTLTSIVRTFPSATFIVLGQVAQNAIKRCSNNVKFKTVKHPQCVRRFDSKANYSDYLKNVISPDVIMPTS